MREREREIVGRGKWKTKVVSLRRASKRAAVKSLEEGRGAKQKPGCLMQDASLKEEIARGGEREFDRDGKGGKSGKVIE